MNKIIYEYMDPDETEQAFSDWKLDIKSGEWPTFIIHHVSIDSEENDVTFHLELIKEKR